MIGDRVIVDDRARRLASALAEHLRPLIAGAARRYVVAIAGESGSGKSTIAFALAAALEARGGGARVLQQDDYFVLPPRQNAARRRRDLGWVGEGEVRLARLAADVALARQGAERLNKPLVSYAEDRIDAETLDLRGCDVLLVEGTYVLRLPAVDQRVFIARDYRDTLADRRRRARDATDAFGERVLEIEHRLIAPQRACAQIVITRDFAVELGYSPVAGR